MWSASLSYQKACESLPTALQDMVSAPRGSASIRSISTGPPSGRQESGAPAFGQVLVDDHLDLQVGRIQSAAKAGVGRRAGDQELGVIRCVADRPEAVQFQLLHPVALEHASERQYLFDVA